MATSDATTVPWPTDAEGNDKTFDEMNVDDLRTLVAWTFTALERVASTVSKAQIEQPETSHGSIGDTGRWANLTPEIERWCCA